MKTNINQFWDSLVQKVFGFSVVLTGGLTAVALGVTVLDFSNKIFLSGTAL